jgi:hypothetical protein
VKKDFLTRGFILASAVLAFSLPPAQADVIVDDYVGEDDHGHGDVIGNPAHFDIFGMEVIQEGDWLTVIIETAFAGRGDDGLFERYTRGDRGIGYGDLFLAEDTGTGIWDYGFSLDNRWSAPGSHLGGTLYRLNSGDNSDILMSDYFMTGGSRGSAIYRNGQEVAVNRNANVTPIAGASYWSVNDAVVRFHIDLTGTSLSRVDANGLRWGLTCANDVIEGSYTPVSEPGTLALFGLGLFGLAVARRRAHGAPAMR